MHVVAPSFPRPRPRVRLAPSVSIAFALATIAVSAAAAPPGLPPRPGSAPGPAATAGPASSASSASPAPTQSPQGPATALVDPADTRRGIVQVEQNGRPIAVGTVLARDGRVLTALSPLAGIEQPELRFADGTVVKARIGHRDPSWDLALLVPLTGRWLDGLMPTDGDPLGVEVRAFLPTKAGKLGAPVVGVKGRVDARARDGGTLKDVLDVDFKGSPAVPGAPMLEPNGRVVGVVVKICKGGPAPSAPSAPPASEARTSGPHCAAATYGAPVYALRSFLLHAPATAVQPAAWLGLGGSPSDAGNVRGVKIVGLAPGSPAEKAGLRASTEAPETIVALDGAPIETPEQLADAVTKRAVGQTIKLLVFSAGRFREVLVTLKAAP
jgi:serine protease Do